MQGKVGRRGVVSSCLSWLVDEGLGRQGELCMGYLLEENGSAESALTAYRWGHDNGTRKYANAVIELSEKWNAILNDKT